ncbi:MAG: beta-propeller fold lactonase family protein, partial [Candidatus Latescibacteria bacterium]|nr:beta-propeller fold lactonase family protein [Candidatus Latescibacterota bacterium]
GLDHTGLLGSPSVTPTMNPFSSAGGQTELRSLEPDDIAGISTLYPTTDFLRTTGQISGTVTTPTGSGVFGAQVTAFDPTNGRFLIGALSGFRTGKGGRGEYTIFGLVPGSYAIQIEPLDGPITDANFGGIFERFDTDVPSEFYDNAASRDGATPVSVVARQETKGIDFITGFQAASAPVISDLTILPNTPDTEGPYRIEVTVRSPAGIGTVQLIAIINGTTEGLPMHSTGGDRYTVDLSGQPVGTEIVYAVEATALDGQISRYPTGETAAWPRFIIYRPTGAPLAYVALRKSNAISVIDTGSLLEIERIPVGVDPLHLVLSPDDSLLYVANAESNDLSIVHTSTSTVLATLSVGQSPLSLVTTSDGKTLCVANSLSGTITLIDALARRVVGSIPLPGIQHGPFGLALTPDDQKLYATDIVGNLLYVVDLPNRTVITTLSVVSAPRSVVITPDGRKAYATGFDGDGISVIDTRSDRLLRTVNIAPATSAFNGAFSPDGTKLYVTDHDDGEILVLDVVTDTVERRFPASGQNTRGVAVSPDGKVLFVSNQDTDDLVSLDANSGAVLKMTTLRSGPRGIVLQHPVKPPTAVVEPTRIDALPTAFALDPPYPNPFNPTTTLTYRIPSPTPGGGVAVWLGVWDALGRHVRWLVDEEVQGPGEYRVVWDGRDGRGREVASGIYFVRMKASQFRQVRKIVLVR